MRTSLPIGAVLALAATIGCSPAAPSGGPFGPDMGGSGDSSGSNSSASGNGGGGAGGSISGNSSGGSGGTGGGGISGSAGGASGSSGSSAGGSGGGNGGGGSGSGSSGGSGSGSSSGTSGGDGGAAGSATPTHGCGQATTCTPGSDLTPPASSDGFQIAVPPNLLSIAPGQEAYYCYYKTIQAQSGSSGLNVGAFQSWMTKGYSHHFILFTGTGGTDGTVSGGTILGGGGAGVGCVPSGTWVYATSTSGQVIELKMPDGVGLPLPTGQQFIFNIHLINTSSQSANPTIKLNVLYAQNVKSMASAMVSFNAGISVPAGGNQDVRGSCSPPTGSKFFAFTTHVHRHGGSASTGAYTDINYVTGGQSMNIVHSNDWENPDVALWGPPNFLTTKAGDTFTYDCHFVNTDATAVTFGETAANGEMCMGIGYYFPAGAATMGFTNPYCH